MGTQSYYNDLAQMSLSELQAELQTELRALSDVEADPSHPDKARQLTETRDNISEIKKCIANKG